MNAVMPSLTKMDRSISKKIWTVYEEEHYKRVTPITVALEDAVGKCFKFSFSGWDGAEISFDPSSFTNIAHLIKTGIINVKCELAYFKDLSPDIGAIYVPEWDMLLLKENHFPLDLHDDALVVHETVHMINDRDKRTLKNIDN